MSTAHATRRPGRPVSPPLVATCRRLKRESWTLPQIAAKTGLARSTVADLTRDVPTPDGFCATCGDLFERQRADARFCSDQCRRACANGGGT